MSCDWCGKFIVAVLPDQTNEMRRLLEIFTDESGRLIKDENDLFAVSGEHRCKAVCGSCGKPIIMERGKIYDRPSYDESKILNAIEREVLLVQGKSPHSCPRN